MMCNSFLFVDGEVGAAGIVGVQVQLHRVGAGIGQHSNHLSIYRIKGQQKQRSQKNEKIQCKEWSCYSK